MFIIDVPARRVIHNNNFFFFFAANGLKFPYPSQWVFHTRGGFFLNVFLKCINQTDSTEKDVSVFS